MSILKHGSFNLIRESKIVHYIKYISPRKRKIAFPCFTNKVFFHRTYIYIYILIFLRWTFNIFIILLRICMHIIISALSTPIKTIGLICETGKYNFSVLPIEREPTDKLDEGDNHSRGEPSRFKSSIIARRLPQSFTLSAVEEECTVCTSDCSRFAC